MATLPNCRFEHFGINVIDIEAMQRFYCDLFGFIVNDRGVRFNGQRVVFLTKSASHHHELVLIEGRPQVRSYSLVGPCNDGICRIAVKRLASSRGGSAGMWRLQTGDRMTISSPSTSFMASTHAITCLRPRSVSRPRSRLPWRTFGWGVP